METDQKQVIEVRLGNDGTLSWRAPGTDRCKFKQERSIERILDAADKLLGVPSEGEPRTIDYIQDNRGVEGDE